MGASTNFDLPSPGNLHLLSSLRRRCYTSCSWRNRETILYCTSCQRRRGERKICCGKVEILLSSKATNWCHLQNLEYKPQDKKWLLISRTWARYDSMMVRYQTWTVSLQAVINLSMRYRQYIEGKKFPATAPKRIIFYRGLLYLPPTSCLILMQLQTVFLRDSSNKSLNKVRPFTQVNWPLLWPPPSQSSLRWKVANDFFASSPYSDFLPGACQELGIAPKITIIVVGKRHHVRSVPRPLLKAAIYKVL